MFYDDSRFPIVVIKLDEAETLDAILTLLTAYFDAGKRLCMVVDGTRGMKPTLDAPQRKKAAEFMRTEKARMQQHMYGVCTASRSQIVRGVITAVQWLSPLPIPGHVCGTLAAGIAWAEARVKESAA